MKIYDLLCNGRNLGRSEAFGARLVESLLPGIASDGLRGAVRYFDGLTSDARLVLDTLRSAAGHGAMVRNYCRLEAARRDGAEWVCQVRDARRRREWELRSRCVINAAGPWGDRFPQSRVPGRRTAITPRGGRGDQRDHPSGRDPGGRGTLLPGRMGR